MVKLNFGSFQTRKVSNTLEFFLDNHLEKYLSIKNEDIVSVIPNKTHIVVYTDINNIQKSYIVTYNDMKEFIKNNPI